MTELHTLALPRRRLAGMPGFALIWAGQVVSLTGTRMTAFALMIWAWQKTGEATALALLVFFNTGATILASPLAGVFVDRWSRKKAMVLSDLGSGLATLGMLALYGAGRLELWHVYLAGAVSGAFQAFQFPALSASVTLMVGKDDYTRASGMLSTAQSAAHLAGPLAAGLLVAWIGVAGVMGIDIVTFLLAVAAILAVHIPSPESAGEPKKTSGGGWLRQSGFGFRYLWDHPPLLSLQLVFFAINFTIAFSFVIMPPMILARTGNNEAVLGTVMAMVGLAGVLGGLSLIVVKGPRRKIHGVLLGMILASLLGTFAMGLVTGVVLWSLATFFICFLVPVINGCNQAIWQAKVPAEIQGRVFAVRRVFARATSPLGMLTAGPCADYLFEPAMAPGGGLAPIFGGLVGTGPGAGMSVMFIFAGLAGALVGLGGYLLPAVRNVETALPDQS